MSTTTPERTSADTPRRGSSAQPTGDVITTLLRPLASLQLTVGLFVAAVILVFLGTLAQKGVGIWTVVDQYFWSWIVMVDVQHLVEFGKVFYGLPPDLKAASWAKFPFPGGKLLGGLMFLNLLAAHLLRFRLTWKRSGIFILHAGILLLFVGEFITREFQVEQQMHIPEGGASNYAFDTRNYELAFVDGSDPQVDRVTVVPATKLQKALRRTQRIQDPQLPVDIEVLRYMVNSDIVAPEDPRAQENPATEGLGKTRVAVEEPEVSGVDVTSKMDFPSVYVRFFKKGTDEPVGTYLVSLLFDRPQTLTVDGQSFALQLRHTRYYKPFSLQLIDFRFDRYVGTNTAKNYSSHLRLVDPEKNQDREVTIRMNDPLRHRGETFYQSSFTPDEKTTILQVVRNPGWLLPYIACVMVTVGMLVHFGIYLTQFLVRTFSSRRNRPVAAETVRARWTPLDLAVPVLAVTLAGLYILGAAWPRSSGGKLDLREVARLPVVDGGRVKPLDTVARVDLRLITHAEEFKDPNGFRQPAIKWFLDSASGTGSDPGVAAKYQIFRIEHDQVRDLLKLPLREGLRYSIEEMKPRFQEFDEAAKKARARPEKERDLYEAKLLELRRHIEIYLEVWQGHTPLLLPPGEGREWRSPATAREVALDAARLRVRTQLAAHGIEPDLARMNDEQKRILVELFEKAVEDEKAKDPAAVAWENVLEAYRSGDKAKFETAVTAFRQEAEKGVSSEDLTRVRFEAFLNETGLFYHCTVMYIIGALLALAGWIAMALHPGAGNAIRRSAFWWLLATFAVHTFTLLARMYLMDRPLVFVTNLYSSAVFIGWGVVLVTLIVELLYPIGIGNMVGAVLGFITSIIAHNLAASGDTLEMMQAVLDTNFWLATHVTTVTFGYAATYIAGAVGLAYVALYALPPQFALRRTITVGHGATARPMELGRILGQIIYGVVCFATLLSFVGTVLGGIWADQSWGRFWGWDPKENGAVLIVLWNALILHARWVGLVKDRGMALLSLVGIMITTWSWFGTNQLGVGLHAYGFSNKLAYGCALTWILTLLPIMVGLIPWPRVWAAIPVSTSPPARR